MSLSVHLITSADNLSPSDLQTWNELAPTPLLRWEWLGSWWRAYQGEHQFYVLAVKRDGQIIGFAPWFLENRISTGRTIQFLGSGKACTDHLSLIVRSADTPEVCDAIAAWLLDVTTENRQQVATPYVWDAIELIGVDADDTAINCLVHSLQSRQLTVKQTEGLGCYVIDLPKEWEDYVQQRSKSGRRELRQSMKNVDDGAIKLHFAATEDDLDQHWDTFVTLHQRRRSAMGTTGCFDHPPFERFIRDAASQLLHAGLLKFLIGTADGVPVVAQFAIADDQCWYFYQSGMEPDSSDLRPGLSTFSYVIREAIQTGRQRFDMMRGDEPYKLRWRAELRPAQEVRVCSPRAIAQVRNQVLVVGQSLKNLVKSTIGVGQPN
jgi:CelD/BcsL family acetyltransferase involved in cellulose biosynthesis